MGREPGVELAGAPDVSAGGLSSYIHQKNDISGTNTTRNHLFTNAFCYT